MWNYRNQQKSTRKIGIISAQWGYVDIGIYQFIAEGIKFRIIQSTAPVKNMTQRKSSVNRSTKETSVSVSVNLDGTGKTTIQTGINFLDHLITAFGKHGMMDLKVNAKSNDKITHHLIEDTAITIGLAIDKALGTRSGITRFSYASVPMDESLAEASIDLVKRPFWKLVLPLQRNTIEDISKEDLEHFFQSLLQNLNSCIHLTVKYGDNDHHKVEAAIKSLAVAFREASSYDKKQKGIPSTKGSM